MDCGQVHVHIFARDFNLGSSALSCSDPCEPGSGGTPFHSQSLIGYSRRARQSAQPLGCVLQRRRLIGHLFGSHLAAKASSDLSVNKAASEYHEQRN
jgi:hypothetical protein